MRVVLYSKPGCHLCDDMRAVVNRALDGTGVPLTVQDIATDLDLFVRYQHDIPILTIDGWEVARHRVDEEAVRAALRTAGIR